MTEYKLGTREEWQAARERLLAREKELTCRNDELARERQQLPWVPVEKEYRFETDEGTKTLAELFDGRSQLFVYHFMFGPDYEAGCPVCSSSADTVNGAVPHLKCPRRNDGLRLACATWLRALGLAGTARAVDRAVAGAEPTGRAAVLSFGVLVLVRRRRPPRGVEAHAPTERRARVLEAFARFLGDAVRGPVQYVERDWSGERWTRDCPVCLLGPACCAGIGQRCGRRPASTGRAPRPPATGLAIWTAPCARERAGAEVLRA